MRKKYSNINKTEKILLSMAMSQCLSVKDELEIYERKKKNLMVQRDRLKHRGEKGGLIESYRHHNLFLDFLTSTGKKTISMKYPDTWEIFLSEHTSLKKDYKRLVRNRKVGTTIVNALIAEYIGVISDYKPVLYVKMEEESPVIINKSIMGMKNQVNYYAPQEYKPCLRDEVRSSKTTGILISTWEPGDWDEKEKKEEEKRGTEIKSRIYLLYQLSEDDLSVSKSIEDMILREFETKYKPTEGVYQIVCGEGYKLVSILMNKKTNKKEIDEKPIYIPNSMFVITGRTYYVRNGREGIVDLLLLAYPQIVQALEEELSGTFQYEQTDKRRNIVDGHILENANTNDYRMVFVTFPLCLSKLVNMVLMSNEKLLIISLESQVEMIKTILQIEDNEDVISDEARIKIVSYGDDEILKYVEDSLAIIKEK